MSDNRRYLRSRIARVVWPLLLAVSVLVVDATGALAVTPSQDIASPGPLNHIYLGDELSCQVSRPDELAFAFFPPDGIPGDCGTFLVVSGTLYAPDFASHAGGTATIFLGPYTPFTPVSQTGVTGSGVPGDPFMVVTTVDVGATGLQISQVDSYVTGDEYYLTDLTISNPSAQPIDVILYRAADCYDAANDFSYGFVVGTWPGCSTTPNNDPPGRYEYWTAPGDLGVNNYIEASFDEVWTAIGSLTPFPNTCRCTEFIDTGAGISWTISIPALGSVTKNSSTTIAAAPGASRSSRSGPPAPGKNAKPGLTA
jgi:hypothetical protein